MRINFRRTRNGKIHRAAGGSLDFRATGARRSVCNTLLSCIMAGYREALFEYAKQYGGEDHAHAVVEAVRPRNHEPTDEERTFIAGQFKQAKNNSVTCECGTTLPVRFAFRCYYCGGYFCATCAAEHFGESRVNELDDELAR